MMYRCWRCGVDFDQSLYNGDAPCADCQLDVPGRWERGWPMGSRGGNGGLTNDEVAYRTEIISRLHHSLMTDPEIAEYIGISTQTVMRWRRRLKLRANTRGGHWHKRDPEAASQQAREMAEEARKRRWK